MVGYTPEKLPSRKKIANGKRNKTQRPCFWPIRAYPLPIRWPATFPLISHQPNRNSLHPRACIWQTQAKMQKTPKLTLDIGAAKKPVVFRGYEYKDRTFYGIYATSVGLSSSTGTPVFTAIHDAASRSACRRAAQTLVASLIQAPHTFDVMGTTIWTHATARSPFFVHKAKIGGRVTMKIG